MPLMTHKTPLWSMNMACKLIGYLRVSTAQQGESGLGLAAQQTAIAAYVKASGCDLVASYTEVETATNDELADRPELVRAIRHAKRSQATLVIAKLDRLVRSTIAMSELKRSKVKFVACDMPTANEFTIDIHVAVAAEEARKISERTRNALAAYKAQGRVSKRIRMLYPDGVPDDVVAARAGKLGAALPNCANLNADARQRGAIAAGQKVRELANEAYADLRPDMISWRAQGMSQQAIADKLNAEGHTTRTGKPWNQVQVKRVLDRW
jgi:DNA invertase Pin-like site-specific DNA recombinase